MLLSACTNIPGALCSTVVHGVLIASICASVVDWTVAPFGCVMFCVFP